MKLRLLLLFSLFVFAFSTSALADSNDSIVIWSEDFTGCYTLPTSGKNASYDGSKAEIYFSDKFNNNPGISLGTGKAFKATINLYGAHGTFTLTFASPYFENVEVRLNGTLLTANDLKYTFDVAQNTSTITLTFKKVNSTAYIDKITLKASSDCRESGNSPELAFSDSVCNVNLGERAALPVLRNPHNQDISFWSSDQSVATVDDRGKATPKSVGETTVYAICHGGKADDGTTYSYQEVSYKLKVNRTPPSGQELFYESFDKTLEKGGYNDEFNSSSGLSDRIRFDNDSRSVENLSPAYKCIWFGLNSNDGIYQIGPFKNISGKDCTLSFKAAGGGTSKQEVKGVFLSIINGNKEYKNTINCTKKQWNAYSVDLNNVLNDNSIIQFSGNRFYLDSVSLVVTSEEEIGDVQVNISKYCCATLYYGDRALIVPDNMKAYTMKVQGDSVVPSRTYNPNDIIAKGEAVLVQAKQGSYTMKKSENDGQKDVDNQLRGTDNPETTEGGTCYYLFGVNPESNSVGFLWGEEDGKAFVNGAHKAYLPIKEESSVKAAKAFTIVLDNQTTEIKANGKALPSSTSCYNLAGQRVSADYKGIVLQNGKKVLRK